MAIYNIFKAFTSLACFIFLTTAAPITLSTLSPRANAITAYTSFHGNGSPTAGWPTKPHFLPFETLWSLHEKSITQCPSQTPQETAQLKTTILKIDKQTGYNDPAGILTQILQESGGCLRITTTWDPTHTIRNTGVLQACNGKATCFGQSTCPMNVIEEMVRDGVVGNGGTEMSLMYAKTEAGAGDDDEDDAQNKYRAARMYNSGERSLGPNGDLWTEGMVGTECYASDYANIRIGYVGSLRCDGKEIL